MTLADRIAPALVLLALTGAGAAQAADAVKPGQWEFNSQLQAPAMPQMPSGSSLPPGVQAGGGNAMKVSHTQCIEPDKAVPSDPRRDCQVDRMDRKGAVINWATTCKSPQGDAISFGTAHYRGNTMQASLQTRVPNGSGGYIETKQHITGRYLGPCPAK